METELTGKQAPITPEGVFIIGTYDENGVPNAMNAAWGSQSDYGEITLFLAPHKTTENVVKTGAFIRLPSGRKRRLKSSIISELKRGIRSIKSTRPVVMFIRVNT